MGVSASLQAVLTADPGFSFNYMQLRSKPIHNSLLNVKGPWTVYIVAAPRFGLVMFGVLNAIAAEVARSDGLATIWPAR